MNKTQLTKSGYEALKKEHDELAKTKRPLIIDRLQKARQLGDLKENSEYSGAREELTFIDNRILEIELILKNSEVISNGNGATAGAVTLGNKVTVEANGQAQEFEIVGDYEADITQNKLSQNSPIGRALLGKKTGDVVEVKIPAGSITYKIAKIN